MFIQLSATEKVPYFTPAHIEGDVLINNTYFKKGAIYHKEDINFFLPNLKTELTKPMITKPTLPDNIKLKNNKK